MARRGGEGKHEVHEPPPHWPAGIRYLFNHCQASPGLSRSQQQALCQPLPASSPLNASRLRSHGWVKIHPIKDKTHPAYGQHGLFAARDIPPRTPIVQYIGVAHTEAESDDESDYDLKVWSAGQGESLGIDSTVAGNEARFVNDYRGIAQRQNVFFDDFEEGDQRGLIFRSGSKPIKAGEELLTSYGKGFWAARRTAEREEVDQGEGATPHPAPPQPQPVSATNPVHAMLERQRQCLQQTRLVAPATSSSSRDFKLDTLTSSLQRRLRACNVKLPHRKAEQLAFDLAMTAAGVKPACLIDAFFPTPQTAATLRGILTDDLPLLPSTSSRAGASGLALVFLPGQEQLFAVNVARTRQRCEDIDSGTRWINVGVDAAAGSKLLGPPAEVQRALHRLLASLDDGEDTGAQSLTLDIQGNGAAIALAGFLLGYPVVYTYATTEESGSNSGNNLADQKLCLFNVSLVPGGAASPLREEEHQLLTFTVPQAAIDTAGQQDELEELRRQLSQCVMQRLEEYRERLTSSRGQEYIGWKAWLADRKVMVTMSEICLPMVAL